MLRVQRESRRYIEGPVPTEGRGNKTARERSCAVDHTMPLLTSQLCINLHALFASTSLFTFNDDKLLECSAVRQLSFIAPAVSFLAASI